MKKSRNGHWYHKVTWNTFAIHHWRTVWIVLPKTASTSVRKAIAKARGWDSSDVHHMPEFAGIQTEQIMRLKQDGYLCIATVRHPLARLASCWKDKVMARNYYPEFEMFDEFRHEMPFDEFVHAVAGIPDEDAEPHFRSLAFSIEKDGEIIPDVILDQDTLTADWAYCRQRIEQHWGRATGIPDLEISNHTGFRNSLMDIPLELMDVVYQRYQRDYELLDYSRYLEPDKIQSRTLPAHKVAC